MPEPPVKPIEWLEDHIRIIDQRKLPATESYLDLKTAGEVADAITDMALRGAPLIGIAAAMGVALEACNSACDDWEVFSGRVADAIDLLSSTRPTASNLFWALRRMRRSMEKAATTRSPQDCRDAVVAEAVRIFREDLETGMSMGRTGADLIKEGHTLLTHCNAGGLATSGFGTALAPMYFAHSEGRRFSVYADETRPLLQGARLTAWELARAGIEVTVICDSACHLIMARGRVDLILVGADRITLSGDFANKVGTLGVALSARRNGIPFYVVAPTSSIDFQLERGDDIPIEERDSDEITHLSGVRVMPAGVAAYNPAFDVTPAEVVTGFITERGLIGPPFKENLNRIRPEAAQRR
jgi:methylthioribose-1-phosphate isomerase